MRWKQPSKSWFRENYAISARIGLSIFLILILVIQNITLVPQANAINNPLLNSSIPLSSSSPSKANREMPIVPPSNTMSSDDVSPAGITETKTGQLGESKGAEVTHVYDSLDGYAIKATSKISSSDSIKELRQDPRVAYIEADQRVQRAVKQIQSSDTTPSPALTSCGKLTPTAVTANGNDGNVPSNVLDNNANTRWSNNGIGSWIQLDLGSKKSICSVDIAWYRGSVGRQNNFVISTSDDGTNFVNKFSAKSSGTTSSLEKYNMPVGTEGRYVRITVNGNNENNWASITEIAVFGSDSTTPPGTNQPPTADSKSVTTSMNTPVDVTLSGQDPEGGPLTFSIVDQPTHGTLGSTITSQGVIRYTPATGYAGPDSFTYVSRDDKGAPSSSKATVSITVTQSQPPPTRLR